ncbi:polyprenyl synthetase family protein [Thermus filiformis]|uniref:Geranylgeranyl diphosphate synthase n=1 Tax=Thermus filiformis TaxID=276 RepID=A0A0A2WR35_THEFI|nr:polyprenyl synthetase family protein [Thermus filiformis]KGQ21197.2 geranylgeranyl diphosphate synthase [Thermus filiformis]
MAPEALRQALRAFLMERLEALPEREGYRALLLDYPRRGGKALRGLLTLYSALAHGAPLERALPVAAALELFQNWVLIHDDIEDGSLERRGEPALHHKYPMPLALNAGDALHAEMWGLLLGEDRRVLEEFYQIVRRTAFGQHLDLAWTLSGRFVAPEEYLEMVRNKAAYYTAVAPLRLGALLAGREPDGAYERGGEALGVAFQIVDDLLNLTAPPAYGKEKAGDLWEGKRTLILAYFLEEAAPEEKERLLRLLSLPRPQKPQEEVEWLHRRLLQSRALERARREAERLKEEGMALLRPALEALPNPEAARALLGVLEALVERQA